MGWVQRSLVKMLWRAPDSAAMSAHGIEEKVAEGDGEPTCRRSLVEAGSRPREGVKMG